MNPIRVVLKSKFSSLLLATLMLLSLATAAAAQKITVVHMHDVSHQPEWTEWLRDAKAGFEALHPNIEIEIIAQSRSSLNEKMIVLWGTGEHPDVTEVLPTEHYRFALDGMFRDLTPFMEKDSDLSWDEFFPVALEAATVIDTSRQWPDVDDAGVAVGDRRRHQRCAFRRGRPGAAFAPWLSVDVGRVCRCRQETHPHRWRRQHQSLRRRLLDLRLLDSQRGRFHLDRLVDPTRATVNTEQVTRALNFIQDALLRSEYAKRGSVIQDFAAGRVSIYMHGGPNTTPFVRNSGASWEWSYAANPVDARGGSEIVIIGLAMSDQTKHPEATWEWIKFLVTEAAASPSRTPDALSPGAVAENYHRYFDDATEWEQVWIQLISHPDSYNRLVVAPEVLNTWNTYLVQVLEGKAAPEVAWPQPSSI